MDTTNQPVNATEATYNVTNDRLKVWFDDRLPEAEYKKARDAKFQFWHGSGCFSAVWSPEAEDFILSYGITIEEDDTPDDVESRVERYQRYAANDEQAAEYAEERARTANTRRQLAQAENTAANKIDEARYWHDRIAGAIRLAAYKDKPDVITRRIKRLEADKRREQRTEKQSEDWIKLWNSIPLKLKSGGMASMDESALFLANRDPGHCSHCFLQSEYPTSTYEGPRSLWSALNDHVITGEQAQTLALEHHGKNLVHARRWIAHLDLRIEYETAYLVAVGGSAEALKPQPRRTTKAPEDGLKKGDVVYVPYGGRGFQYNQAEILSLHAKSARVRFTDPKLEAMNTRNPKGYQVGRYYIKKELPK